MLCPCAEHACVHDRATTHTKQGITLEGFDAKLRVVNAPPRSPDLMPLDYAVFGNVKRQLLNKVGLNAKWEEKAECFWQLIQDFNVSAAIESYPKRIAKCMETGGGRVEGNKI